MDNTNLNLMKTLEDLNEEYKALIDSKEYKLGKIVAHPEMWIERIQKKIYYLCCQKKKVKTIKEKYVQIESAEYCGQGERADFLRSVAPQTRVVVYTCITGGYDMILEPMFENDNIHYIIFTDNQNLTSEKWEIRSIPKNLQRLKNNVLINRYIKMHPHTFFKGDFDYSIYVDGNVKIVSDLTPYVSKCSCLTGIAMHHHVQRICAYQEAEVCVLLGKGNPEKIHEQMERFRMEGFPENFGLYEATIIAVDLNNDKAGDLMEQWWMELTASGVKRDQLCFPYLIWKNGLSMDDVGCLGENVYTNPKIRVRSH